MSGPASVALGPPLTPPRVSLYNSAEVLFLTDEEFGNGVTVQFESCDGGLETYINCGEDNPESLSEGTTSNITPFIPLELIAAETCSTFGNTDAKFFKDRAKNKLIACQSKLLEYELWTGFSYEANNHLASETAQDITSDTAIEPEDAIDSLDDAIASAGCSNAFIHVSPFILAKLSRGHNGVYKEIDSQTGNITYFSPNGNKIIGGAGYPGTSPDGDAPTSQAEWVYTSSPVVIRLGPIVVDPETYKEALNKSINEVTFRATRIAEVEFDDNCVHFAAKVKRNGFVPEPSSS